MWRYYAKALVNGGWLHRDLPLEDVQITYALSGPGSLNGSISNEWQTSRTLMALPYLRNGTR